MLRLHAPALAEDICFLAGLGGSGFSEEPKAVRHGEMGRGTFDCDLQRRLATDARNCRRELCYYPIALTSRFVEHRRRKQNQTMRGDLLGVVVLQHERHNKYLGSGLVYSRLFSRVHHNNNNHSHDSSQRELLFPHFPVYQEPSHSRVGRADIACLYRSSGCDRKLQDARYYQRCMSHGTSGVCTGSSLGPGGSG